MYLALKNVLLRSAGVSETGKRISGPNPATLDIPVGPGGTALRYSWVGFGENFHQRLTMIRISPASQLDRDQIDPEIASWGILGTTAHLVSRSFGAKFQGQARPRDPYAP